MHLLPKRFNPDSGNNLRSIYKYTHTLKVAVSLLILLACTHTVSAQTKSNLIPDVKGYLKELGEVSLSNSLGEIHYDNIIHHRIENKWAFSDHWELEADLRTRLLNGYAVEYQPGLKDYYEKDANYFDMSWVWFESNHALLHSNIDRAYLSYYNGPWEVTAGRQRINWSRTFVWSPNDLFNNFAYLDFDYEERPGTDALNLQYSWSYASSVQLTTQFGHHWDESVIAGMLRASLGSYDIQFIGGHYRNDLTVGAGWAGYLGDAGFKGEISYFHPENDFFDHTGHITATTGFDYMFSNGIYLQSEFLYNGGYNSLSAPLANLIQPPSADNLFVAKSGFFINGSYQVNPLISAQLGLMGSFDRSIFIPIPQISISVTENVDFLLLSQLLKGSALNQITDTPNLFFFRLKWSY
ncbi:MAG: hypothetical protein PVI44_13355 [Balneolaceae bacterium]|jgi:hypothetical protein